MGGGAVGSQSCSGAERLGAKHDEAARHPLCAGAQGCRFGSCGQPGDIAAHTVGPPDAEHPRRAGVELDEDACRRRDDHDAGEADHRY